MNELNVKSNTVRLTFRYNWLKSLKTCGDTLNEKGVFLVAIRRSFPSSCRLCFDFQSGGFGFFTTFLSVLFIHGTHHSYCNMGYAFIGYLVEQVSGTEPPISHKFQSTAVALFSRTFP